MRAFPIDSMPPRSREAIQAQAALGNYPIAGVATAALAIMAYAGQGYWQVADPTQPGRAYPISQLYMVLVPSGDAKSSIYSRLMAGVARWQANAMKDHEAALLKYSVERELHERNRKVALKDENARDLLIALDKHAPRPPRSPRNTPSKTTTNGIYASLEKGYPTYGLFTDEGGSLLAGHSLRAENSPLEFASTVTMLWDKGEIDRTTGELSVHLSGRRLSGLIMVQPETARAFLQSRELASHGIHARFGIVAPPAWEPRAFDFTDAAETRRQDSLVRKIGAFNDRIEHMLKQPLPFEEGSDCVLDPPTLRWSADALSLGVKIMRECLERRSEQPESYWKRLGEHVCRTAGVLAAFESETEITQDILKAAWALVCFYADEWKHLDLEVGTEGDTRQAPLVEKVLKKLRAIGPMSARDIQRHALSRVDKKLRDEVLKAMIADELIEASETVDGARRSVVYRLPA